MKNKTIAIPAILILLCLFVEGAQTRGNKRKTKTLVVNNVVELYRAPNFQCWRTPKLIHRMETISYTQTNRKTGKTTYWECGTWAERVTGGVAGVEKAQHAHVQTPSESAPSKPSLRIRSWCVNQHWLAHPERDGSLTYHFIGRWTERQKVVFLNRCDSWQRSVIQERLKPLYDKYQAHNAHAQQKPPAVVTPVITSIPAESQQKIRNAFQAERAAQLTYDAALNRRLAVVNEAKAQAKCWPCELSEDAQGVITFVAVSQPSPSPK